MPSDVPLYGELVSVTRVVKCPHCESLNSYIYLPGMAALSQDYECVWCGGLYTLYSDE
jgi:hypothetical protein